MNVLNRILMAVLLMGFAARGYSQTEDKPSFENARTKFGKQNAELNEVYKAVMSGLDKTKAAQLREDERRWLQYRQSGVESYPRFNSGKWPETPAHSVDYWQAMSGYTKERIKFLRAWSGKDVPPGITGEYSDSYGRSLKLEETKDGIKFSIVAVTGSARHVGDLNGIAERRGDKAYYKEKLDLGDGRPPCELVFIFVEGHVAKVMEKARDPDAGMGVSYIGDYYKIGKLRKS